MLNQYPGLSPSPRRRDDSIACYGVIVVFFSLLLFCVLAASVSVVKACAFTGMAAVFFGIIGWFASGRCADQSGTSAPGGPPSVQRARCACRRVDAPISALPTFAYNGGVSEDGVPCSVCLEDVQGGEMVRQLPACNHLFHVDCIDMWLYSHRTCPLCRCELWPQRITAKAAAAAEAAESSADALPPV